MLRLPVKYTLSVRHVSQVLAKNPQTSTSKEIRDRFSRYFVENENHKFVRSSPVVPLCDPTVAFVNAGMNQFKSIFLGKRTPTFRRAVNSQKCVRVGGKHNDLKIVGTDSYHHTFFEMLGNWSFGDYFKRDACRMAWELITKEYRIDPKRLYVTYFSGDSSLNLPVDEECYHLWRELGVAADRILPFGSRENFWEMGPTGPCGPCSEIHIDHLPGSSANRGQWVNKDLPDLTELWNIVFIQYMRHSDGSVTQLPESHIDTGMGLERLTAVLQGKMSNYDTDLFTPIFDHTAKVTKALPYSGSFSQEDSQYALDTAYRLMADHSRMITACLADGMLPDQNHKLRRVIRKVLQLSDRVFNSKQLPYEVIPVVVEILGDVYPEMQTKLGDIFAIVRNEEEIIKSLRGSFGEEVREMLSSQPKQLQMNSEETIDESDFFDNIGLLPALKDFKEAKQSFPIPNVLPDEYVMRLYGTFGLDEDLITRLGRFENVQLGESSFQRAKLQLTRKGKDVSVKKQNDLEDGQSDGGFEQLIAELYPPTEDSGKYEYIYKEASSSFAVEPVNSRILGIIVNNNLVPEIQKNQPNEEISVILERTNFYCESGGQECDTGKLITADGVAMDVSRVQQCDGRILHVIENLNASEEQPLAVGNSVRVLVNSDRRTGNSIHHTGTHLLNTAVRQVMKTVVYQKSSSVKEDTLRLELGIIGSVRLDREHIKEIERQICEFIARGCPVGTKLVQYDDIGARTDIVTVPGEIYPEENLRLISIAREGDSSNTFKSLELCCGTHVRDVNQIKDFCITNVKQVSRGTYQITAVAGEAASRAVALGRKMKSDVEAIRADLGSDKRQMDNLESRTHRLKSILQQGFQTNFTIPYVTKAECLEVLTEINKEIRDASRETLKEFIEIEMNAVLLERPQETYIVHNLTSSALMEDVKLQKATRLCTDRPILVMCVSGGQMKARACVPTAMASDKFNAQVWLQEVAHIFKASVAPPKGQNAALVCNMKAIKVKTSRVEERIEEALSAANEFARQNL